MTAPRPRVEGERVALLIALEELKRWPDLPGVTFYCYDPDGGRTALQSEKVEHIFDALHRHAVTLWRTEQEAVGAWSAMPALRAENARLTAEVERLRGVMEGEIEWLDGEAMRSREQEEAEARLLGVSPSTAPMVHFFNRKDKLRAALALPTPAPEATNDG